jgi:hypothetical protein
VAAAGDRRIDIGAETLHQERRKRIRVMRHLGRAWHLSAQAVRRQQLPADNHRAGFFALAVTVRCGSLVECEMLALAEQEQHRQACRQLAGHVCEESRSALALHYRNLAFPTRFLALGSVEAQGQKQEVAVRWYNSRHRSRLAAHPTAQPQARRVV